MSHLQEFLSGWAPTLDADSATAARELAEELRANGMDAAFLEAVASATGVPLVLVNAEGEPSTLLLVHDGETHTQLRKNVRRLLSSPPDHPVQLVAPGGNVPGDVSVLFSQVPVAALEMALARSGEITPGLLLTPSAIRRCVRRTQGIFKKHLGEVLEPGLGMSTLEAIDRIVLAIRPGGLGEEDHVEDQDAVWPPLTLSGLGLIASETVRGSALRGRYMGLKASEMQHATTLAEVEYFPAIGLGDSVVNVAMKVRRRWENGSEDSVALLWRDVAKELAIDLPKRAPAEADDDPRVGQIAIVGLAPYAILLALARAHDVTPSKAFDQMLPLLGRIENELLRLAATSGPPPLTKLASIMASDTLYEETFPMTGAFFTESGAAGEGARAALGKLARETAKLFGPNAFWLFGERQVTAKGEATLADIERRLDGDW